MSQKPPADPVVAVLRQRARSTSSSSAGRPWSLYALFLLLPVVVLVARTWSPLAASWSGCATGRTSPRRTTGCTAPAPTCASTRSPPPLVPVLMLGAVIASYASPGAVAPLFIKLYLIWSPYHFSAQTIGITLLYARRCGFAINQLERKALAGFVFLTFIVANARAEIGTATRPFYGVSYPHARPALVGARPAPRGDVGVRRRVRRAPDGCGGSSAATS